MKGKTKNLVNAWLSHSLVVFSVVVLVLAVGLTVFAVASQPVSGRLDLSEVWLNPGGDVRRDVLRVSVFSVDEVLIEKHDFPVLSSSVFGVGDTVLIQRAWANNTGELSKIVLTPEMFRGGCFVVSLEVFGDGLVYGKY